MKICLRCKEEKEPSEYSVDNLRADGLNLYCRSCISEKTAAYRAKRKVYEMRRKPCAPSMPIHRMRIKPREKVLIAIQRGAKTQDEIKYVTRLDEDKITDGLADLYAENKLDRGALKQREYVAASRRSAPSSFGRVKTVSR